LTGFPGRVTLPCAPHRRTVHVFGRPAIRDPVSAQQITSGLTARRSRRRARRAAVGAALAAVLVAGAVAPAALADHTDAPPFSLNPFISATSSSAGTVVTVRVYAGISGFSLICGECTGKGEEARASNLDGRLHTALVKATECPARPPAVGATGKVLRLFMAPDGHPWRPLVHGYHELQTTLRPGAGWEGEWIVCAWFQYQGLDNATTTTDPFTELRADGRADRITISAGRRSSVSGLAVTATQLEVNDRISRAALLRAERILARLDGKPEPEPTDGTRVTLSAAQLQATQRIAQAAIRRAAAIEARLDGREAPPPGGSSGSGRITLTPRQILINQRISQAAIRRLNLIEARLAPWEPAKTATSRSR
jgi:hypothetical protein